MNCKNNCNCPTNVQPRTGMSVPTPPKTPCSTMPVSVSTRVSCDMLQGLPLAMAYVPKQHYSQMFDLHTGLKMGTIFPELCLPFCGKRGKCSC